ncbi:sigma-70 family RNA polymerase sigma factor, partial [Streptomyces sp. Ru87]|uniref:BACON domain-containing protein n=1 Tax=Streptomyces sp. Ru87 TaxID=2044307 RepID=UPI000BF36C49
MSSRRGHPTHTTGTHRAPRRAQHEETPATRRPPARYEPYLDGLFTYCLSVMCEHEAATAVLGEVLAHAERKHSRGGRGSAEPEQFRSWLYALTRWACLRRLADEHRPEAPPLTEAAAARRRRELSALAWPEAAGTTPEQREALELAVRHQLSPQEVAAVIGREHDAARTLLAAAACEVERTRAALFVVERGTCPAVSRLTGDDQVLLSASLRRELVRHVDDCEVCRRTAERASAGGPWPGSTSAPGTLPVLEAPRPAVDAAMRSELRAPAGGARNGPRYDRRGFPVRPKDRAARRRVIRSRVMTTTVVATVVAAPVLALWAAYRGAPLGESRGAEPAGVSDTDDPAAYPYDPAGNAEAGRRTGGGADGATPGATVTADGRGAERPDDVRSGGAGPGDGRNGGGTTRGPGRLTVDARPNGDTTLITLTASGGAPVRWTAGADAPWLWLSHTAGVLRPGESLTITVSVDRSREPREAWTARVTVGPGGTVIPVSGEGAAPAPDPDPTDPAPDPDPTPTEPAPG